MTPNDPYRGRTALLPSKRCILYIYSTNIGTEYFKHGIYSHFSSSKCSLFHNSNVFCSCIIHILYTGCAKIKKNNSGAKRWLLEQSYSHFIYSYVSYRLSCCCCCCWFNIISNIRCKEKCYIIFFGPTFSKYFPIIFLFFLLLVLL